MRIEILKSRDQLKAIADWLPTAAKRFGSSGYGKTMERVPTAESLAERVGSKTALYAGMISGAHPGLIIVEHSPWEEGVIGRPFARVEFLGADSYDGASALLREATNAMSALGVVLGRAASGNSPGYIQVAFGMAGFYVGSQLMTLSADIEDVWRRLAKVPDAKGFRFATAEDGDALARLADSAFTEARFVSDPNFPKEWGNKLYVDWGRTMTTSDEHRLLVLEQNGEIVAAGNIQRDTTKAPRVPGLFVVTREAQGAGLGPLMLKGIIKTYRDAGQQYPLITTEKSNTAVNSLFFRLGYRIENVNVIYHWTPRTTS